MTGFYYKPGWEECPQCGEKVTLEVEYQGQSTTDRPTWIVIHDFCWACEDPVPLDWELMHLEAWVQAFPLLTTTKKETA